MHRMFHRRPTGATTTLALALCLSFSPTNATAFAPIAVSQSKRGITIRGLAVEVAPRTAMTNSFSWWLLRGGGEATAVPTVEEDIDVSLAGTDAVDTGADTDRAATASDGDGGAGMEDETTSLSASANDEGEDLFRDEDDSVASVSGRRSGAASGAAVFTSSLSSVGRYYSTMLERRPVFTKSLTAALIFTLSDVLAQAIENAGNEKKESYNWLRTLSSMLVGLLYFGPAAHYWYEMIFRLLPGTSLGSTLIKAFWGQVIFGPSFTCVFFAASLLQSGTFTLGNWGAKIKTDLPAAWLAGVGYWPLVDLVSYSLIPIKWIPLFVNMMSLIWNVYLSIVSNRIRNHGT